jgi:hypothetical protein
MEEFPRTTRKRSDGALGACVSFPTLVGFERRDTMRVIWSVLFGLVMCASLPGCGGAEKPQDQDYEAPTTKPEGETAGAPLPPPE